MRDGKLAFRMASPHDADPKYILVVQWPGGSMSPHPFVFLADVEKWLDERATEGCNIEHAQLFEVAREVPLEPTEVRHRQPDKIIRGKSISKSER